MKIKIIPILTFCFALMFMDISCNKSDNFNYPAGTVGISKIVYFPAISTNGNRLVIMAQGGIFTDSGATATLGGSTAKYTTTGSVDATTPGVYGLVYTSANAQGNTASDFRTVVVIGSDVSANDYSGPYLRSSTGQLCNWTKTATGVYSVENPGGASVGVGKFVIAVNYTGNMITIPQQISPDYGLVSSSSETYNATSAPITYSWIFHAGGYGTSLRIFTKQ